MYLCLLLFFPYLIKSEEQHNKYDKSFNEYHQYIKEAQIIGDKRKIDEKDIPKELYYRSEWKYDLFPFSNGITIQMMKEAEQLGNKYQIINHTVYRSHRCLFKARCEGIDFFLKRISSYLNDTQFYLNEFDHPKAHKITSNPIPIFSFSKNDEYWDILYPAWSFHKGGPAISLYPNGIGDWMKTKEEIERYSDGIEWSSKENKGFFLGSRTNNQRDQLILLSREYPSLVHASFTKNQAYKGLQDTLNEVPSIEQPFTYNCHFKYLFNFRGVAASFRFKHLLCCGSTVIHVDDGWIEFFYNKLIPYYHYIPVYDNTKESLKKLIEFAQENDDEMKRIGMNGRLWIDDHLNLSDIDSYWIGLLEDYTSLINFNVQLDDSLMNVS